MQLKSLWLIDLTEPEGMHVLHVIWQFMHISVNPFTSKQSTSALWFMIDKEFFWYLELILSDINKGVTSFSLFKHKHMLKKLHQINFQSCVQSLNMKFYSFNQENLFSKGCQHLVYSIVKPFSKEGMGPFQMNV